MNGIAFVRNLWDINDRKSCFNLVSGLESIEEQEIDASSTAKMVKYRRAENVEKNYCFCVDGDIAV